MSTKTKPGPDPAPAAEPLERAKWFFGDPPHGSGAPPNLTFNREDSGRLNASGVFRRDGSAEPEPADRTPVLVERARAELAKMDVSHIAKLNAEKKKLTDLLALCDERAADLAKRQDDPALLAAPDFCDLLKQFAIEAETIAARRAEAEAALTRVRTQLAYIRPRLEAGLRNAVGPLVEKMKWELMDRRRILMADLAFRIEGLLEELLSLHYTERRRPDAEAVVQTLLGEAGLKG